ncbi:uncharacterized protein LOC120681198 [Panicum virgatum]|uniref:uncharacterized protein LOC120681198 n=1 Tax=Panicum virgatum TaxID=38727 RepID=UPI0019D57514|nr:uncharacterized protein LOC120681198 [Panicum virgatum]
MEDSSTNDVYLGLYEVPTPIWMEEHPLCNVEDWKAFQRERPDGRHDWFYSHREYTRMFRSKPKVEAFLEALSEGADMFEGRKLHKRTMDFDDAESGGMDSNNAFSILRHIAKKIFLHRRLETHTFIPFMEHYQEDEGKRNGEGEGRRMGTGKRMVVCTGCISSDAP